MQCKFFDENKRIDVKDVSNFLGASGKSPFIRRVFVDTTATDWTENADAMIASQSIPVVRIGLEALRESAIDWAAFESTAETKLQPKKQLREHQRDALHAVERGFSEHDRGKLIMACGTGKTFTALKIAEKVAGKGKRVLFLVPSLALIAQTVREWTKDSEVELRSFAVCSDTHVGKRRKDADDVAEIAVHELDFPATTDGKKLATKAGADDNERMTVVFSTYQSIPVLSAAQAAGLQAFDLIICDEAHRTTGAKINGEDESNFIRVHDNKHVQGAKRLYMTATPRIYGENARAKPGIFIESHSDGVSGRFWSFGAAAMLAMAAATTGSRAERCREGAFRRPEVPLRCRRAFAAQDDASPMGVAGIRAAGLFAVRYGSGSAQCRAMSRGQSTAQNGAAADESASTILRPEITRRAPARSTRSRRRRRLQPVPVACAMARRAMCMTS